MLAAECIGGLNNGFEPYWLGCCDFYYDAFLFFLVGLDWGFLFTRKFKFSKKTRIAGHTTTNFFFFFTSIFWKKKTKDNIKVLNGKIKKKEE